MFNARVQRFIQLSAICVATAFAAAEPSGPRALPPGELPKDSRLGELRTLDSYFPFKPVASKEEWATRSQELRRQLLVATGLWPLPQRGEVNAMVHGKVERDDFTVERVIIETVPGFYLTGSLFKPKNLKGKAPVVLTPHGHWANGRFCDQGEEAVRNMIAVGAERFEPTGRHHLQAICVQLARMGCIVFFYDTLGNADSVQLGHRPGFREAMNGTAPGTWGFFSPQAELRLQNMMGLQTWNSLRALDFMLAQPEADTTRVMVTGASGGGTQSFMLAALDDRITLSVPAVMVSTAMQGGCTCENAPYLRIGAGNIDIAGLAAPRPQLLIAANDWTKEVQTKGMPDLRKLYEMLGAKDNVRCDAFLHFDHNYNSVSRTAMYNFVNKHFKMGFKEPVLEKEFQPLSIAELTVWTGDHPKPTGDKVGDVFEKNLLKLHGDGWVNALQPKDASGLEEFKRVVGGGWEVILGRKLDQVGTVTSEMVNATNRGEANVMTAKLTVAAHGEQIPSLLISPRTQAPVERVAIWVTDTGKAALLDDKGEPVAPVAALLKQGVFVIGLDMVGQGEFTADGKPMEKARVIGYGKGEEPWQRFAAYTFGYNPPLFSQRVHDVLSAIQDLRTQRTPPKKIYLVGVGRVGGAVAAAARAQAGDTVAKAVIQTDGFRFGSINTLNDVMFTPGAVKYGDVDGLLALSSPNATALIGAEPAELVKGAFEAAGAVGNVKTLPNLDALADYLAE